jgi:hypothetical protein
MLEPLTRLVELVAGLAALCFFVSLAVYLFYGGNPSLRSSVCSIEPWLFLSVALIACSHACSEIVQLSIYHPKSRES